MVIGKNGSGLKKLEKKSGCLIDIDKKKNQIHLQGSDEAIKNAIVELDDIILSVEESVEISGAIHSHFFGKVIEYCSIPFCATLLANITRLSFTWYQI